MKRSIIGGDPQSPDLITGLDGNGKAEDLVFLEVVNGNMPSDNEVNVISTATVYSYDKFSTVYLYWDDLRDSAKHFQLEIMSSKKYAMYKHSNVTDGRKMWIFGSRDEDCIRRHSFNINGGKSLQPQETNRGIYLSIVILIMHLLVF